jgi:hypothetical protein
MTYRLSANLETTRPTLALNAGIQILASRRACKRSQRRASRDHTYLRARLN